MIRRSHVDLLTLFFLVVEKEPEYLVANAEALNTRTNCHNGTDTAVTDGLRKLSHQPSINLVDI